MVVAAVVFLLPVYLFDHELIAPEGKPITAPALGRLLVLGFELVVWGTCVRLLRGYSPLLGGCRSRCRPRLIPSRRCRRLRAQAEPTATQASVASTFSVSSWAYAGLVWLGRRRRLVTGLVLAAIAAIIALDVRGYSFTARRLALGGSQTTVAIAVAVAAVPRDRAGHQPQRLAVGTSQPFLGDGSDLGDGAASKSSIARGRGRIDRRRADRRR